MKRADAEDVVGVALDDAVVDDVAVEVRQVQVADRADEQQHQDHGKLRRVGPEVGAQEPDHRVFPLVGVGRSFALGHRLGSDPAHRTKPCEEALELGVGHTVEQRGEVLAPLHRKVAEDRITRIGRVDEDHPAIVRLVAPLDEAALLHAVDDPGRARDRDIQSLGELAHGERAVGLEHGQHMEVDEAERPAQPVPERAGTLTRAPGGQFLEEIVDYPSARAGSPAIIQWHIDNL